MGYVYGSIGAVLAIVVSSIGSCIGVGKAGQLAGGFLSKDPSKFTAMLILQLLPATQGLYGFIVAFMALSQLGMLGGGGVVVNNYEGLAMLVACLPITVIGFQGKVVMAGMEMCVKQEGQTGHALLMAVLVEIFAIFSFVISLLAVLGVLGTGITMPAETVDPGAGAAFLALV